MMGELLPFKVDALSLANMWRKGTSDRTSSRSVRTCGVRIRGRVQSSTSTHCVTRNAA